MYNSLSALKKWNKFLEQHEKLPEKNKNDLFGIYFAQLCDENYTDWDIFIKKFNDIEWKENEKNKPIIEKLANLLNCTCKELNRDKINK